MPVTTLPPKEAYALLTRDAGAVLIDVRSHFEFDYIGHPLDAINIPWIEPLGGPVNPHFVDEVTQTVAKDAPVLLLCRSGVRSLAAGEALLKAGYATVFNVGEGFEGPLDEARHRGTRGGWRFHGLPWEQG